MLALCSSCGTAAVSAALGGNGSGATASVPEVTLLSAIGSAYPDRVRDLDEGVSADRPLELRFSLPMREQGLQSKVHLETPRDGSLRSVEFLGDDGYVRIEGVQLEPRTESRTTYLVTIEQPVLGTKERLEIPLHGGRWYRLRVDQGAEADNGEVTQSRVEVRFRVRSVALQPPEVLGLESIPDGVAILPDGQGLVTFETGGGERSFSVQSRDGGGFSELQEIANRRFAAPADGFPASAFPSDKYRQSNAIGLVTSRSGRAYRTSYEPKISVDDTRHPVSFFIGVLDDAIAGSPVPVWTPSPDREATGSAMREDFGSFDGSDESWASFRDHVVAGGTTGTWAPSVDVVHSWYPQVTPIGDLTDTTDGPERALCVWTSVPRFDPAPLDPTTMAPALAALPANASGVLRQTFDTMREALQSSEIRARVYDTADNLWKEPVELSSPSGRPHRSAPFVLQGDGLETLVVWYESSRPIPLSSSILEIGSRYFDRGFNPIHIAGGQSLPPSTWWPTLDGTEDFVVVHVENAESGVLFGSPEPLQLDDNDPLNPRTLAKPLRIERTSDGERLVILGVDPLHSEQISAPPLVAQVIEFGDSGATASAPIPVQSNRARFSIPAAWKSRSRPASFFFGRISPTKFMLVIQGKSAPPGGEPALLASVFDVDALAWTDWEQLTDSDFNLAFFNSLGVPNRPGRPGAVPVRDWDLVDAYGSLDEDGNLTVLVQQSFDLNEDTIVSGNYEESLGLTSVLYFDAKVFNEESLATAWSAPIDLIDRSLPFVLTADALLTASDSAGRMISVPRLTDPYATAPGYTLAALAVRFSAD